MPRHPLTRNEFRIATSAGLASVVLMLMVWFVLPTLEAAAYPAGAVPPGPVRLFRACYGVWPATLFVTAAIGVFIGRLDPRGQWRGIVLGVDALLAIASIFLIGLGAVSAYMTIALLPAQV